MNNKNSINNKNHRKNKNKRSSGRNQAQKDAAAFMKEKPSRSIAEYFYFTDRQVTARDLQYAVRSDMADKTDIWPDLNLMEVVMDHDSLIFQDAAEFFVDPIDQEWFAAHNIRSMYEISYDTRDIETVREVMHDIISANGGRVYSETDDFEPSWGPDDLDGLQ